MLKLGWLHENFNLMPHNKIVPLTEVFENLSVNRLVLGEDFHELFLRQAQLALKAANVQNHEDWAKSAEEWARLWEEIRLATEAAFGVTKIRW